MYRTQELEALYAVECNKQKADVMELGGLHVVGTERHESRRIDNQLRGRTGRQGDPGSTRFFLSLEDNIFRIFGGDKIQGLMSVRPASLPIRGRCGTVTGHTGRCTAAAARLLGIGRGRFCVSVHALLWLSGRACMAVGSKRGASWSCRRSGWMTCQSRAEC